MPTSKTTINLLTAQIQPQGRWDRIYSWTVNTAKYIIILTEIIVLAAIGFRVILDGKINDLDQQIDSQRGIWEKRREEEAQVRALSVGVDSLGALNNSRYSLSTFYKDILGLIPATIEIKAIDIDIAASQLTGTAASYDILLQLEKNLKSANFLKDVNMSTNQSGSGAITFTATFNLNLDNK